MRLTLPSLDSIREQILVCRKCRLWRGAINAVPGEGPDEARVMLVGQNPGREEDLTGRPFVGRTGRYLNGVLALNGIKREELFITGIVKHVTPCNRMPRCDEVKACVSYLAAQIEVIKPEIVLLMGKAALQTPRQEGIIYIETVHPSAAMRFPKMRQRFEADITELAKRLV